MSVKLSKRLSSKKKKPPKDNAQSEVLSKLGLESFWTTPLDPASMLDISTWALNNQAPLEPKDLPNAFLQRLWLLRPDARSPSCKLPSEALDNADKSSEDINGFGGDSQCGVNPLDLVAAVFMSSNTFLQQEMAARMMQCQFAVPLVLPNIDPEKPSRFLLWPLRGVVSQWTSHFPGTNRKVQEGFLASTCMPVVSCVKFGHCSVSKSQVLNNVISGLRSHSETFLHRGMDGAQMPRRLSNGLVEIGWYLPTGDTDRDIFTVPLAICNLRGDASVNEKSLILLCQASSAMVIFCGDLREKEKQLLASCKDMANKVILIDVSDKEKDENRVVGFADENLEQDMGLPEGSVLPGQDLNEEELADRLSDTLKYLLPNKLKCVTIEAAEKLAVEVGLNVDEEVVCKKAMATVEEVLKGLDEGPALFRQKQLPLQGDLWNKLAEIEKEENKERKEGKQIDPQLQKEKKDISVELSSYKMTPAMKIFTDALFTTDIVERTYFLNWMKLRLQMLQMEKQNSPQDLTTNQQIKENDGMSEQPEELENGVHDHSEFSDSFCTDSSFEEEDIADHPVNAELQVSEPQSEAGQVSILQTSTEGTTEPESEQKAHLESTREAVIEQQLSDEKEVQGEEILENNGEQISEPISDDQNLCLESGENGTLSSEDKQPDEPQLTLDMSHMVSSVEHMNLDPSSEDQVAMCSELSELDPSLLGLEHFLREMGLIFELTHITPGSGSHNVLRLPSLAADLILYGIPLELMDGDASNIPIRWLSCVLAELKRRLPQEQFRTRILTSLGGPHGRNAEVLSALFGVKFPDGGRRSTRGVYMVILCLPDNLRKDMECDFLLLIDVEGLCSMPLNGNRNTQIYDNEMATVAVGLSDVLLQNISSHAGYEFETNFTVVVNALLRIKECGVMPSFHVLVQDEGINSVLQASQLRRVTDMLQTETGDRESSNTDNHSLKTTSCTTTVKGPWYNTSLTEPVDAQYSKALLKLKQNLFGALKTCAAKSEAAGLPEFMGRLCSVWDAVKAKSFCVGLQNTDIALAFSMLCTELSLCKDKFLGHMESWFMGATKKISDTKAKTLDATIKNDLLSKLKDEAREEVKTEVDKLRSKVEINFMNDDHLKMYTEKFKPILMSNMDDLQGQVTEEIIQRLETVTENHCSSTQLEKFEALLEKVQESKLHALVENSKSTKHLLQDKELEDEFEEVWNNTLSNFDFRPSETDDITERVTCILKENLVSRGLQKHMNKLEVAGENQPTSFQVYDEHFGYRSRLKHMFEDNNRLQRVEAQQLACNVIDEYNQFVADKSSSPADFSDSYITEILENVEKALNEKPMEIRTAFEVDLKVYLCSAACRDFQEQHDRYAKDSDFLTCIKTTKGKYLAEFIYQLRKRDQCQRLAQAFTSMVIKPTVLDYIYRPLGMQIMEETKSKAPQYLSRQAFHKSLLEELVKEDRFESFMEYLHSYDSYRLRKIKETVVAHLSESTSLEKWRQHRLGEIVGKIAAAVSQTAEGTNGVLSDTKPLLERVCLTLERDGDVDVNRACLNGPFFSITTEWDRFITCLMELLAAMRLDLAQEFSQDVDINQLLQCLPIQPQDTIFNRVRGCDKQCPFCKAPCEVEQMEHDAHRAMLHRPKGLFRCESSLSCISQIESLTQANPPKNMDTEEISVAYSDLHALEPNWSISPGDPSSETPIAYWRYVLSRFNEKFAKEYKQEPAKIPEEWKWITKEEAIDSLNEAFFI